jgi:hypothetical protein
MNVTSATLPSEAENRNTLALNPSLALSVPVLTAILAIPELRPAVLLWKKEGLSWTDI